jgi:hypothetical protein
MATSYTAQLALGIPARSDRNWDTPLASDLTLLDQLAGVLLRLAVQPVETPSTTLNVKVGSGSYRNAAGALITYAGTASQAITASTTKYLYLTDAGVLTVGAAWPAAGTSHVRLAIVVAGGSSITSITDARVIGLSLAT